ncbi:hypothetical protein NQ152_02610 [Microbacterium sp. zg.B48]|uniref:hypothetical protein n=1 Tax=Microbacterium sp. zg.B48 TaxID=2969408 RepID=UPI00214ADC9B|nr:hypothetical protein [Microbacterium sp. zg.B48]MCR2762395.1 hypothetical protein [Microbacterium sp. zg.B48]
MSGDEEQPPTPPVTHPPANEKTPPITRPPAAPAEPRPAAAPGITRAALIWIGVAVIALSFVASFLGATLARSAESAPTTEPITTPTATSEPSTDEYEDALEEILPAGAAVRAGSGVPAAGKGYEGEVYIDISTADLYLFQDGEWVKVGNIRAAAAEHLTGQTGPEGAAGETGSPGEAGAPGAPGTQISLGVGTPANDACETDGDIFIDTEVVAFYQCTAGAWIRFGPSAGVAPAPLPTPTTDPGSDG